MNEMKSGTPTESGDSLGDAGIEDDKERAVAKAALTISEVYSILDGPSDSSSGISLRSITAVAAFESFVEDSRALVDAEMEHMVINGLKGLVGGQLCPSTWAHLVQNQTVLASSLQTAYNLGVLPELVKNLLRDLSQAMEDRIKSAFDLSKISKEALAKGPTHFRLYGQTH